MRGDVAGRTNKQTITEDRATQPMDAVSQFKIIQREEEEKYS